MPIINIKTMKGALSVEQKERLQKGIADLMVEVEGNGNKAILPYVIMTLEEEEPLNFSIGGMPANLAFIEKITKPA
jgi:4-oxalocrotonate tautomerase